MVRVASLGVVGLAACALLGCSRGASPDVETPAPAPVTGVLRLSQEQAERIGVELLELKTSSVVPRTEATGWLEAPPGGEVIVRAPVVGFLVKADGNKLPALGQAVGRTNCAVIQMFLTPIEISQLVLAKEDTDIQIQQSQVSMQLAEAQLRRLKDSPDSVARTRIEELRDLYERSKIAWNEAREKLPYLATEPYDKFLPAKPVMLSSPMAGVVTQSHAVEGQLVLAGDPLWTVSDWSTLWLRVPVFEGDLPAIRRDAPALVGASRSQPGRECNAVEIPLAAKPLTRTMDLIYAVDNHDGALRPGQSLTAALPQTSPAEALVIPRAAVVYDTWGAALVYVQTEPGEYARRRVELGAPLPAGFPIRRGLSVGEKLVTTGAAALFAADSQESLAVEDDD